MSTAVEASGISWSRSFTNCLRFASAIVAPRLGFTEFGCHRSRHRGSEGDGREDDEPHLCASSLPKGPPQDLGSGESADDGHGDRDSGPDPRSPFVAIAASYGYRAAPSCPPLAERSSL